MSQKMIYKSGKEQIVFDAWEKNEEFGGYWVDLCPDCIKKYHHLLDGRLDDSGSGSACCSVCGCMNENAGCYADFKEDEVTFKDTDTILLVFIQNANEQEYFCKELAKCGFCWMSGTPADQIPKFIRLGQNSLSQILVLYVEAKRIGILPKAAIKEIMVSCVSVEQALSEIVPDEMSETLSEESEPKVVGFLIQHGHDDYSYWNGFSLTEEEKKQIQEIICRHDTEGYSIRGSKKEILKDISSQEDPVNDAELEEKIRKCLDQIYAETDILPENFGDNILRELKVRFAEDSYEITEKTVLEEMLWCYMNRMQ